MNIVLLVISGLIGYLFWKIVAGKYPGDKPKKSLLISLSKYQLHIHHWIWCMVLLIVMLILKFYNPLLLGFLAGSIIQGLSYADRFVILYKKEDYQKIYSKFK
jgi:hypothetical protein